MTRFQRFAGSTIDTRLWDVTFSIGRYKPAAARRTRVDPDIQTPTHGGVTGLILASGRSTRYGSEKLLAPLGGLPVGRWVVEAALASDLERVALIVRPELAAALTPNAPNLVVAFNPDYADGQAAAIRIGMSVAAGESSHVLIMLADQPLITTSLLDHYVALARAGAELAALRDGDRLKPPALFRREHFQALGKLGGDEGGRSILDDFRDRVTEVEQEVSGQAEDIDRPEDLERIKRRLKLL